MVYVIHFKTKLKHAQHYVGYCKPGNLLDRMQRHLDGKGAKILKAANDAGIEWWVTHVWDDGDRTFERSLKRKKHTSRFCPACTGKELSSFVNPPKIA